MSNQLLTPKDVAAWCRTQEGEYDFTAAWKCALAKYVKSLGGDPDGRDGKFKANQYRDVLGNIHTYPDVLYVAAMGLPYTYAALAERLEALG